MDLILYAIFLPLALSALCFLLPRFAWWIALLASAVTLIFAVMIFAGGEVAVGLFNLRAYVLSSGAFLAASFFALLIILYSSEYMKKIKAMEGRIGDYYCYMLMTLGATAGVLFSDNYFTLLVFWGLLGATLYMLIGMGGPKATTAAKKSFLIVGGSDAFMILGVGLVWMLSGNLHIAGFPIMLNSSLAIIAFLSLCAGAFAKAGAIPLHTWIPDSAEVAPIPVMAFLPASLDKLLGIYLLARICLDIFVLQANSAMSIFLLCIGSLTIIAAVMSALVQHDLKKLLSFHAVSQVGYMVVGIGTANPIGIAGGLFHMLNHAIYKSCLFLSAGAVEKEAGTTDLDKLGGLSKFMPITFVCASIAALSISGVPPLNGFASKWMIYQGIIGLSGSSKMWIIWLICAMFGSALTLASFIKVIHAVFLGQWSAVTRTVKEAPWTMWLPMSLLALLCLIFGIFAYQIPLSKFIIPSVGGVIYAGAWNPSLATILLIAALAAGALLYWAGSAMKITEKPPYIGGEPLKESEVKVSGGEFYNTIKDWGPLASIYRLAEKKLFDIYEIFYNITFALNRFFSWMHNGYLGTYIAWMLFGVIALLFLLR